MTDSTAVEFVLEKMMRQLINSDDQLILEAYEKKVIDKDQIQSLYEDLQFLGKFLKDSSEEVCNEHDHEQLKQLVSKIRDVTTCEVDDIIDSLVLTCVLHKETGVSYRFRSSLSSLSITMVELAEKIYDGFNSMTQAINFVKDIRTEAINLLSSCESLAESLADHEKIGDRIGYFNRYIIIEDIKRCKIELAMLNFEEDVEIGGMETRHISEMKKGLFITWLQSDVMPHEFGFLFKLSKITIDQTKKIRDCLCGVEISTWLPEYDIHLLLHLSQEMAYLVEGISCLLFLPTALIQRIKEIVETIFVKLSTFKSLNFRMATVEFHRKFSLSGQTFVQSLSDPHHAIRVIDSIKTEMMNICAAHTINRFGSVIEDIKSIKTEVKEIYEKKLYGITGGGVIRSTKYSFHGTSSKPIRPRLQEETVVGLDEETKTIKELLAEEDGNNHLNYISIFGMPGLGKTTLAKKVYNDSFIEYHFYIRAWIYVSQVYQKRDLLLAIFNSAFPSKELDDIYKMHDEKLGEELYKRLKGKRYLIIMDDVWNPEPWYDLKRYFPNDSNGSRILFTTRHKDVAVRLHAKRHHLRFLNEDESWALLRLKTFFKESCPLELMEIGKQIATKCQGLPLAIVVISGLLAKQDKTLEWWKNVAESVRSYMVSDPEQYMQTLDLSYNVLPHCLKACFLYLGAFTEAYEIPVRKLIWLWVAEGFIKQNAWKTSEEVAEDYLMDLIDRSLVIVSKKRSNGEIKAFHVHDLVRDFCLRKAQEQNFLHQISVKGHKENSLQRISNKVQEGKFFEQIFGKLQEENLLQQISEENIFQQIFGSSSSSTILNKPCRMCIHLDLANLSYLKHYPFTSKVCSILSFGGSYPWNALGLKDLSFIHQNFKLLRVLGLSSIRISLFPERITQLFLLRYLALHVGQVAILPPSISNLLNLETLIIDVSQMGSLVLSDHIWKMVKLRHLNAKQGIKFSSIPNDGHGFLLDNLQTVGGLFFYSGEERALKWIPNLRRLKCCIMKRLNWDDRFPKLDFLIHLEALNVLSCGCKRFFHLDNFPPNLRSLTLSYVGLSWEEMSTLGMLPNLEVLKLLYEAFRGSRWETNDGEFRKLRFLKFQDLDIDQWNASSNHFPRLQQLVLKRCESLKEIPSSLGDISTLDMIQLWGCSDSAENSAREIQEQQRSMGNDGLKIQIFSLRAWLHK